MIRSTCRCLVCVYVCVATTGSRVVVVVLQVIESTSLSPEGSAEATNAEVLRASVASVAGLHGGQPAYTARVASPVLLCQGLRRLLISELTFSVDASNERRDVRHRRPGRGRVCGPERVAPPPVPKMGFDPIFRLCRAKMATAARTTTIPNPTADDVPRAVSTGSSSALPSPLAAADSAPSGSCSGTIPPRFICPPPQAQQASVAATPASLANRRIDPESIPS